MALPLETSDPRIPVTIVTGFLGSGKTTLLSSLLRRANRERIAVIINEFGEVSLDDAFVDAASGKIVTLAGGCLCCAVAGDIVSTLVDLYEARSAQGFDRVVIETSGLADPDPIAMDLLDAPELTTLFRLDGVVCVVDALQGLRELERQRVSTKQIAMADRLVLTKTDIASQHAVARLRDRLAAINPSAPLVAANHGAVDFDWLLDPVPSPISWAASHHGGHAHHDHGIRSFCLWFEQPLHSGEVQRAIAALLKVHGEKVLRIKGLLNLVGERHPTAIHGIASFLHPPEPLLSWPSADRRSRIVFIVDRLTEAQIAPFFEAFGTHSEMEKAAG
jgi:G3E family GTPase